MHKLWHTATLRDGHFVICSKHNVSLLYHIVGGDLQLVLPSTSDFRQLMVEELHCDGVSGHFVPEIMFVSTFPALFFLHTPWQLLW